METFLNYVITGDIAALNRTFDNASETEQQGLLTCQDNNGRTPLHLAALNGQEEAVDILLKKGADVNVLDFNKNTPIYHAILSRSLEITEKLVENQAVLEWYNANGESPLHYAAGSKSTEILNYILEQGVDVNSSSTPSSETPIYYAAKAAWLEGMKILVDYGAEVDPHGCLKKLVPIIITMYRNISSPKSKNTQSKTLIREKSINSEQAYEIVQFLVEHGADVNAVFTAKGADKNQETSALQDSIVMSDEKMVEILLQGKISLNKALPNGKLPLELAVERNSPQKIIQMLIESKADAMHLNDDGQSYLHLVCMSYDINLETLRYLIDYYSSVTADYNSIAEREMNESKSDDNPRRVGKRIADIYRNSPRKVDPFFIDKEGNTPLFYAAQGTSQEAVKMLIEYGCDPKIENKRRYTAYSIAKPEMSNYMYSIAETDEMQELFEKLALISPYHNKVEASASPEKKQKSVVVYSKENVTRLENRTQKSPMKSPKAAAASEKSPAKKQIQTARPWGGFSEAEEFRRQTRKDLRKLKLDMNEKLEQLKKSIQDIAQENDIEL